jgi:hypothetical protein
MGFNGGGMRLALQERMSRQGAKPAEIRAALARMLGDKKAPQSKCRIADGGVSSPLTR